MFRLHACSWFISVSLYRPGDLRSGSIVEGSVWKVNDKNDQNNEYDNNNDITISTVMSVIVDYDNDFVMIIIIIIIIIIISIIINIMIIIIIIISLIILIATTIVIMMVLWIKNSDAINANDTDKPSRSTSSTPKLDCVLGISDYSPYKIIGVDHVEGWCPATYGYLKTPCNVGIFAPIHDRKPEL